MNVNDLDKNFYKKIQNIDSINPENKELIELVKTHINKLQETHDEFVKRASAEGYNLNSSEIGAKEVQFFTLMKSLSKKIGLPVEKYDKAIENIKIRVFGEENAKRFFNI